MKQRLLLIEDNESLLELVGTIMSRQGYEVMEAREGKQALAILESGSFDVVVTDLMLGGMPGLEIIRRIKETHPQTRVVAISGKGEDFLNEAVSMGADAAVAKPFKIAEIVQAVEGLSDK